MAEGNADEAVPLVPEGDSLVYEEELLRNPYSLKLWLRYLEVLMNKSHSVHFLSKRMRSPKICISCNMSHNACGLTFFFERSRWVQER